MKTLLKLEVDENGKVTVQVAGEIRTDMKSCAALYVAARDVLKLPRNYRDGGIVLDDFVLKSVEEIK